MREFVRQKGSYRGSLRQAESVAYARIGKCLNDAGDEIRRYRSAAIHHPADTCRVDVLKTRLVNRQPENCRDRSERVDALGVDCFQEGMHVEGRHNDGRAAAFAAWKQLAV